jgi:hypothetical protein
MANIKQGSAHQKQWSDWLPNVVCVTALLTLISAAAAGFLSQRVTTLASAQKIQQEQTDTTASQALSQAKAQWQKKAVALEKELLSAKLKVKAEQTTSANIRKRLAKIQKDLEALKKTAGVQAVKTIAPPAAAPKPTTAVAPGTTSPIPAATTPTAAPGTAAPGTAAPAAVAPKARPQTVTESSAASPPAPAPAGVANVPVSDTPPATVVPAAPKASQSPAAPAVQPVELAPPANATETAVEEAPDVEENALGATE